MKVINYSHWLLYRSWILTIWVQNKIWTFHKHALYIMPFLPALDLHPFSGICKLSVTGISCWPSWCWTFDQCLKINCWLITTIQIRDALAIVNSKSSFQLRFLCSLVILSDGVQQWHLSVIFTTTAEGGGILDGSSLIGSACLSNWGYASVFWNKQN